LYLVLGAGHAQYGVLEDPVHEFRNKLRDIVRSSIGDARAWKVERRLYLSFEIKGYEEYFNFSAGKTPYEWGCYLGAIPFSNDKVMNEKAVDNSIDIPEQFLKTLVGKYAVYHNASITMLEQARKMLKVVGCPELDSKLFWPRK